MLSLYRELEEDTFSRGVILEGEADLMFDFDRNCWLWFIGNVPVTTADFKGKRVRLEVLSDAI